jgi:hypothetical protein
VGVDGTPGVGIVIVHYRGLADTMECLASVARTTYLPLTVYVVDQGVRDGTVDAVREGFPSVRVIENGANIGYAGGANVGIRRALADEAAYVLLLNPDATVAPDLVSALVAFAEAHPDIGIAGPVVCRSDRPDVVWAVGGRIDWRGQSHLALTGRSAADPDIGRGDAPVDFVVGCGMLVRRAVLETVGLYDEAYFLYYEDADLCARARRAGWKIRWASSARMWHKISQSTGTDSPLTVYYMRRNVQRYLAGRRNWVGFAAAFVDALRLSVVWSIRGNNAERRQALVQALSDTVRGRSVSGWSASGATE